jgi:hypothetical protein
VKGDSDLSDLPEEREENAIMKDENNYVPMYLGEISILEPFCRDLCAYMALKNDWSHQ